MRRLSILLVLLLAACGPDRIDGLPDMITHHTVKGTLEPAGPDVVGLTVTAHVLAGPGDTRIHNCFGGIEAKAQTVSSATGAFTIALEGYRWEQTGCLAIEVTRAGLVVGRASVPGVQLKFRNNRPDTTRVSITVTN